MPPVCRIMDYSKYKYEQEKREKEAAGEVLSIRSKSQGDMGIMTPEEFIQMINKEIKEKVR